MQGDGGWSWRKAAGAADNVSKVAEKAEARSRNPGRGWRNQDPGPRPMARGGLGRGDLSTTSGKRDQATAETVSNAGSVSSSIFSRCTIHARDRMHEREIPKNLVKECLKSGLYIAQDSNSRVFVSDYITVVTGRRGWGTKHGLITTFRTSMIGHGQWCAGQHPSDVHELDTALEVFQEREKVLFVGLGGPGKGFQFGVGNQILAHTHTECYFDTVIGHISGSTSSICPRRLAFRPLLGAAQNESGGQASRDVREEEGNGSDLDSELESIADTRMARAMWTPSEQPEQKKVFASIQGGPKKSVPILRWLCDADTEQASSWLQLDPNCAPQLSFRALSAEMVASTPLEPALHGRWRLIPKDQRYTGVSKYTLVVIQKCEVGDGNIQCWVLCIQSNDRHDSHPAQYSRLGLGCATVYAKEDSGRNQRLKLQLVLGNVFKDPARARLESEIWSGDTAELRKGDEILEHETLPSTDSQPVPASDSMEAEKEGRREGTGRESLGVDGDATWQKLEELWARFLPPQDDLMFENIARVQEYLAKAKPGTPELWQRIEVKNASTLLRRARVTGNFSEGEPVFLLPVIAAALAKFSDVVAALLERQLKDAPEKLDQFVLAVLGMCELAREELLRRVRETPELLEERLQSTGEHPLRYERRGRELLCFQGCTVMELAARLQHRELAQQLRAAGAAHSLSSAVQAGDVEWVRANASREQLDRHLLIRDGNVNAAVHSYTPLIVAVVVQDLAMVQCLLDHGASIFVTQACQWLTPINYAQVYDRDADRDYPILSALLSAYLQSCRAGTRPQGWLCLTEKCGKEDPDENHRKWWDNLGARKRDKIENADLESMMDDDSD